MTDYNQQITRVAEALEGSYNKNDLQSAFLKATLDFIKKHANLLVEERAPQAVLDQAFSKKTINKSMLAKICALPFGSKKCYEAFLSTLPAETQTVWQELIWSEKMHQSEIEKKLGIKVYKVYERGGSHYSFKEAQLRREFEIFQDAGRNYYGGYYNRTFSLSLPIALRQILVFYHDKPDEAQLSPEKEPSPTQFQYLSGEQDILLELPRLLTFKDQGQIKYTAKDRPSLNTLPKIQRSLNLKEFFPETDEKRLKTLRTFLLAGLLAFVQVRKIPAQTHLMIRDIFRGPYSLLAYTAPLTLPDLKGMGYVDTYYLHKKEAEMLRLLSDLPSGEWVAMENIQNYVRYNLFDIKPMSEYTARNHLSYSYEEKSDRYTETHHPVTEDLFQNAILWPNLYGSFFLFAAFGLCDLAYDEPDLPGLGRTCFSSWDGLRFVRRTRLGDYVCGARENYDASSIAPASRITLSPDTLLIITEESDSGSSSILAPYTQALGANRYRTDAQIFLKNIRSKRELEAKITLFKQVIGDELPPNWQAFFQEIIHKIDPFETPSDMHILRIPADNKELIRLAAQDPVIKSLVIKAEGYLILIPKGNLAALKRRLQEFGYLVT